MIEDVKLRIISRYKYIWKWQRRYLPPLFGSKGLPTKMLSMSSIWVVEFVIFKQRRYMYLQNNKRDHPFYAKLHECQFLTALHSNIAMRNMFITKGGALRIQRRLFSHARNTFSSCSEKERRNWEELRKHFFWAVTQKKLDWE